MTFDAWEVEIHSSEDVLMHFGTPGMKHGRRRYQNEDGTWTDVGLAERKKREGWGERRIKRKAARAERREARRASRTEQRAERKAARAEARDRFVQKMKERTNKHSLEGLTDAQLKARIDRVKMEMEYKELTRSPVIKSAEKFVSNYLKNKAEKAERDYQDRKTILARKHELEILKEQTKQAEIRSNADKERAEADKARAAADRERANTDRIDIEKGTRLVRLKNERRNLKLQGKRMRSDTTILGGVRKLVNKTLSGRGDQVADEMRGMSEVRTAYRRGKTDAKIAIKQNRMLTRRNRKLDPYEDKATIRESGQNYWDSSASNRNGNGNENKKKKKGGNNS